MQPIQDLTVEDRVSRTQYQYTLEDADAKELDRWTTQLVDKLKTLPSLRDVATDQQNGGLEDDTGDRPRYRFAPRHQLQRSTIRSMMRSGSGWYPPCSHS